MAGQNRRVYAQSVCIVCADENSEFVKGVEEAPSFGDDYAAGEEEGETRRRFAVVCCRGPMSATCLDTVFCEV